MPELHHFLHDMGIIFLLAIGVVLLCFRLRVPPVIGFLITGMLAGPAGLGLVEDLHVVEMMAEIGVVLLLFTIGIEFSLKELWQIRRPVFLGGSIQALTTTVAGTALALVFQLPLNTAIFCGFLLPLSSTAIVLKLLQEKAEMNAPQGRLSLALLIFQDVAAIPMMLMIPFLAGTQQSSESSGGIILLKIAGVVALTLVSARYIIPWILNQVVATRIRELFLITVAGICLVIAWLSSAVGLSLALGAFIAGLIISESEYSHQAMGHILPFRDVFTSLFFVSTGMLLGYQSLLANAWTLLWLLPLALGLKVLWVVVASRAVGYSLRISLMGGLMLAQIGEFSLIVGKLGYQSDLLSESQYQLFLSMAILSMVFTPIAFWLAARCGRWLPERAVSVPSGEAPATPPRLIIVGYGIGGRNLAHTATIADIPYQILEMNLETVRQEQAAGVPIHYGDATQQEVLNHLGIAHAQVLSIMISDATATRRIVELARRMQPHLWIVVRTRFVHEIDVLYDLGASDVIAEEFESSIEVFSRVLNRFMVPHDEVHQLAADIRSAHYGVFRQDSPQHRTSNQIAVRLPNVELTSVRVNSNTPLEGVTLEHSQLRQRFQLTVLAIERHRVSHAQPGPQWLIQAGDILVLMGDNEAIQKLNAFLDQIDQEPHSRTTSKR